MQNDLFSFTTRQAARAVGVTVEAMRAQQRRTGTFRGVRPTTLPNGRLLWPRAEVLALAGRRPAEPRTWIDVRATLPWIQSLGLPASDPVAEALAIALNDPRDDSSQDPACRLDEWHAIRSWTESAVKRLRAAEQRLTPEQRTDARVLQARAVAWVVAGLDAAILQQAVSDVLGGAA